MNGLFDELDGADDPRATPAQVRALVHYGHNKDVVRKWTKEKAQAVLSRFKRDEKAAVRRARSRALLEDPEGCERGAACRAERETAARYLEQSLVEGGADEVLQAASYTLYVLTDRELRGVAESLVVLYRAGAGATGAV